MLKKEEGESMWPNPQAIVEMGRQSMAISKLRAQMEKMKGPENMEDLQEQIMHHQMMYEQMDVCSSLPILLCRSCKEECEPRSPYHLYAV